MSENNLDTPQEETPGSHTGVAQLLSTGVDERNRRVVIDRFWIERFDDRDLIGNGPNMR